MEHRYSRRAEYNIRRQQVVNASEAESRALHVLRGIRFDNSHCSKPIMADWARTEFFELPVVSGEAFLILLLWLLLRLGLLNSSAEELRKVAGASVCEASVDQPEHCNVPAGF